MQSSLSACSGASSPADGAAKLPGCRGKPIYQWLLPTDVFVLELLLLLTAVTLTLLTNWYRSVLTTTSASRLNVSAVSWEVIWSQGLPPEGGPCPGTLQLPAALPARSAHPLRLSKTLQTRASLNSLHLSFVATTAKLLGDALPTSTPPTPGPHELTSPRELPSYFSPGSLARARASSAFSHVAYLGCPHPRPPPPCPCPRSVSSETPSSPNPITYPAANSEAPRALLVRASPLITRPKNRKAPPRWPLSAPQKSSPLLPICHHPHLWLPFSSS